MSDRIILTIVNPEFEHYQRALVNSIRKNAPDEKVWAICADVPKEKAMTLRVREMLHLLGYYSAVLWLDADIIVRAPLTRVWTDLRGADSVCVLYRPNSGENGKFQTGVVSCREYSLPFLRKWQEKINELGGEWFADQKGMWLAYEEYTQDIPLDLRPLPQSYNDWKFDENSPIWHAKGHYKKDKRWRKEWKKYA